ncbi:PTS N-acetylmuramic acid transporter subunit IIBC [Cardiobacteriaceae bacterium TAE3-ERU3]|nr:PTS N-acetylmuramic acid transporter subunit IIBC [Cardiobacteriaceae bacterium TAE3-ERU3]
MANTINRESLTTLMDLLGGANNITEVSNCMTRLRLKLADESLVDAESIKQLPWVLGLVVAGGQHQVVLGAGKSGRAAEIMRSLIAEEVDGQPVQPDLADISKQNKQAVKARQNRGVQNFFSTFATIFTPLIPGFIAAGLLLGIATLIGQVAGEETLASSAWLGDLIAYMKVFGKSLFSFLGILIGYNAAKAFGGTGVHGAILAGLFVLGYDAEATKGIYSGMEQFFGFTIDPRGNIIGILIAAIVGAKVEQFVRRFIPDNLDMILTSTITLLIMGCVTFLLIMPLGGVLFTGMSWLFSNLNGNPFGSAILAGLFLVAVMLGIHQGFVPVYFALVESQGFNALFPVLAMAGAGQVGAALALYARAAKDSLLRQQIRGAIVPGFLGIGEPLIYGVTLPRIKPFVTACLGGACGGFTIGLIAWLGYPVGLNTVFGPSGLLALPLMTSNSGVFLGMGVYITGMVVAWISGFAITWLFASRNVDLS